MEPQRKFDKLIRAYERAESAGYYRVAGADRALWRYSSSPSGMCLQGQRCCGCAVTEAFTV